MAPTIVMCRPVDRLVPLASRVGHYKKVISSHIPSFPLHIIPPPSLGRRRPCSCALLACPFAFSSLYPYYPSYLCALWPLWPWVLGASRFYFSSARPLGG